jgi:hypothetical protein
MLSLPGAANRWCDGIARREILQIGGLGAVGLALSDLFRARAQGSTPPGGGRAHPNERGYGWMLDDTRPTLTLTYPQAGTNPPLTRILVGMHD